MKFSLKQTTFAVALTLAAGVCASAQATEMTPGVSALYESVSIYPPNGNSMTICYGFVCRRRLEFEFTAGGQEGARGDHGQGQGVGRRPSALPCRPR